MSLETAESSEVAVVLTVSCPGPELTVPPETRLSLEALIGRLSPVRFDSSIVELPSTMIPSQGIYLEEDEIRSKNVHYFDQANITWSHLITWPYSN